MSRVVKCREYVEGVRKCGEFVSKANAESM